VGIDRIEFLRTGGVTGIPLEVKLESQSITSEELEILEKLIESGGFSNLPRVHKSIGGADRFSYEITVDADGKRHTVKTRDPVPESIQELVSFLVGVAKRHKRQSR
jgi:emfourin